MDEMLKRKMYKVKTTALKKCIYEVPVLSKKVGYIEKDGLRLVGTPFILQIERFGNKFQGYSVVHYYTGMKCHKTNDVHLVFESKEEAREYIAENLKVFEARLKELKSLGMIKYINT